jgi:hypothetical protein
MFPNLKKVTAFTPGHQRDRILPVLNPTRKHLFPHYTNDDAFICEIVLEYNQGDSVSYPLLFFSEKTVFFVKKNSN